jgi:predicted amino acid dehydrogenase
MNSRTNPLRPGNRTAYKRVIFIAHALIPEHASSELINQRLLETGQEPLEQGSIGSDGRPGFIKWLDFPVQPKDGQMVRVQFYIIPVYGGEFLPAAFDGRAYAWCERVALQAIHQASIEGYELTIGWGAATKIATNHGRKFLDQHPEFADVVEFSTTHGDAGTAALALQAIALAGFKKDFRVAVIGANGAIGDVTSRALGHYFRPTSITLVGKPDDPGKTKKRDRLLELAGRVTETLPTGSKTKVEIHQDKSTACVRPGLEVDLVVVATNGMKLYPSEVPMGAVVIDMTAPPACMPHRDWAGRLVLTAGCGEFESNVVPRGFGTIGAKRVFDLGMGSHVIWGCTGETIARASDSTWSGHIAGTIIPLDEVGWSNKAFNRLGFHTQPPLMFGQRLAWDRVRRFVYDARRAKMPRFKRVVTALDDVMRRAATY